MKVENKRLSTLNVEKTTKVGNKRLSILKVEKTMKVGNKRSSTLKVGKIYQANWALKDAKQVGFRRKCQTN